MNQYLALTLLTLSSSIVPSIVIPLLLALLLWSGRASLPRALIWLSGAALALGLLDLLLLNLLIFWTQHGAFRTIMPHQDMFPYAVLGVERLLAELSNACAIAAITIGLFATTQQRQRWWTLAFVGGALILWNAISVNVWGGSLLQLPEILRRWSAVSVSLLAHLAALVPLVYGLTQPLRRPPDSAHLPPANVTAKPQSDRETRTPDGTLE
jgi:hypothetical protein